MDYQSLINIGISALVGVLGWFARQLWEATQNLKDDLRKLEINLPTNYVRKADMEARFDRIEQILGRLFDKIDGKADK